MENLLMTIFAAGTQALNTIAALGEDFITGGAAAETTKAIWNCAGMGNLLIGFLINLLFVGIVVRVFYYPKCKRGEFFFTYILIAISTFMLIYVLGDVKLKAGIALGLFAMFSIIRYRTEQVAIREMTYLFVIIAVSAIIIRKELLIPILCGVFFVESLSVIIQRFYYKWGKKKGVKQRFFKRTPIHDHFRTSVAQVQKMDPGCTVKVAGPEGLLHEAKITVRFWIVTIILAALTIITLKIR